MNWKAAQSARQILENGGDPRILDQVPFGAVWAWFLAGPAERQVSFDLRDPKQFDRLARTIRDEAAKRGGGKTP